MVFVLAAAVFSGKLTIEHFFEFPRGQGVLNHSQLTTAFHQMVRSHSSAQLFARWR